MYLFIYVLYSIPFYSYPHNSLFRLYPSDVSMFLLRVKKKGCKTNEMSLFIKSLIRPCKSHWKYKILRNPLPFGGGKKRRWVHAVGTKSKLTNYDYSSSSWAVKNVCVCIKANLNLNTYINSRVYKIRNLQLTNTLCHVMDVSRGGG